MFTEEKLIKILAVCITSAICMTRISMAVGQVFQGLALLTGIILFFRRGRRVMINPESKKYYIVALFFFASTMISAIGAINPGTVVKECFNMWGWRSVPFLLVAAFIYRQDYLRNMLIALLCIQGIEGFCAAAECIILGDRGWGIGPVGTNPLALAGMMCLVYPVACILLLDSRFDKTLKKAAAFCFTGITGGLLGAQSRGAWLVALVSMPIAFAPYARKSLKALTAVLTVAALVVGIFAVQPKYLNRLLSSSNMTTDWSNTHRLWLWESCINMFKDHPVKGIGLGNFTLFYREHGYWMHNGKGEPTQEELRRQKNPPPKTPVKKQAAPQQKAAVKQAPVKKQAAPQQKAAVKQAPAKKQAAPQQKAAVQKRLFVDMHAHNSYFQLLAETGIIGFAGLLFFVLYCLGNSLRNWFKEKNPYDLMFFTSFLAFFVLFAQVEHIVDNSSAVRMMWFLLAVILQMKHLGRKEG